MTAPAPVEKLLAFLRAMTAEERRQVGAWLQAGEADRAWVRAALRVEEVAGVQEAVGLRPTPAPTVRVGHKAPLRLARAMAGLALPAAVADLARAAGRSDTWVCEVLAGHRYFHCTRAKAGRQGGLYDLTAAGRAAVANGAAGVT